MFMGLAAQRERRPTTAGCKAPRATPLPVQQAVQLSIHNCQFFSPTPARVMSIRPHGSKFDHLAYLASFFDTIEINSPFYRIPPPTHAKSWVRRVASNPEFRFTTKVFRGFTHEKAALAEGDISAFKTYLDPLMDAGRLGSILLQFPWSFKNSDESRAKLAQLFGAFDEYPKALEVRHASFQNEDFVG